MMSYYVNYNGVLRVYEGSTLIGEVQECQNMTEGELQCLADEVYEEYLEG